MSKYLFWFLVFFSFFRFFDRSCALILSMSCYPLEKSSTDVTPIMIFLIRFYPFFLSELQPKKNEMNVFVFDWKYVNALFGLERTCFSGTPKLKQIESKPKERKRDCTVRKKIHLIYFSVTFFSHIHRILCIHTKKVYLTRKNSETDKNTPCDINKFLFACFFLIFSFHGGTNNKHIHLMIYRKSEKKSSERKK